MMSESRVRINTRADDTADASTVATTLGSALAPDGFEIVEQCHLPDVADRTECVVSYKRKETMVASLDGKVACELSKHL